MKYKTPPYIVLYKSKEIIFYISNDSRHSINIDLWKDKLKLPDYRGMVIYSKCTFNRLKQDASLGKN